MKSLIGLTINGKKITDKTASEPWPGDFDCRGNQLTTLKGAPSSVGGDFVCDSNKLTSLEGIHKIVKQMNGTFYAHDNPLKSHVLGLLLVKGCKKVKLDNRAVQEILNRYLPNTRGNKALLECQSELLDADLEEFA